MISMQEENVLKKTNTNYEPDLLGEGFEKRIIELADDYEGKVIATLIRKNTHKETEKAILYIHGFNDYFFQKEMAEAFNEQGYNFYALDLRKYGRSHLPHQKLNNVRSILEYDEELNIALAIIKSENNHQVILKGHSTGGLIVTNYAVNHKQSDLFHGLIGNSPFYDFNLRHTERKFGIPFLSVVGGYFPNLIFPVEFTELYGHSLHKDYKGEWYYSLVWKPNQIPKLNLGFISAIYRAQKNCIQHNTIDVPVLIMYSNQSIYEKRWSEKLHKGDSVLNVAHIKSYAARINGDSTSCEIENGMHDLILSKPSVREKVYSNIFEWLDLKFNKKDTY